MCDKNAHESIVWRHVAQKAIHLCFDSVRKLALSVTVIVRLITFFFRLCRKSKNFVRDNAHFIVITRFHRLILLYNFSSEHFHSKEIFSVLRSKWSQERL